IDLSGDDNVIHSDSDAAARSPIGAKAIPGMLGVLKFSMVLGTLVPGHGTVYRAQELQFPRPVLVGRNYLVRARVLTLFRKRHGAAVWMELVDSDTREVCTYGAALVINSERL